MWYGYDDVPLSKQRELVNRLSKALCLPIQDGVCGYVDDGRSPYIQNHGDGSILIRRIARLGEKELDELVRVADSVRKEVLGG